MRTDNYLYREAGTKQHDWQTKELVPVKDLSVVIPNLLKEKFVVEIDGIKYDLSFGFNEKENYIGYAWSGCPSPRLDSEEIVNRAFKEGKWFIVKE